MREKLSAVVVAYNRAPLIGTCLRALAFADEVIMVDKSSTRIVCVHVRTRQ